MRVEKESGRMGRPVEVEATEGHTLLKSHAVAAAEQWRFERVKGRSNWFFAVMEFQLIDCHGQERMMLEKSVSFWIPPDRVEVQGCMVTLQTQSSHSFE